MVNTLFAVSALLWFVILTDGAKIKFAIKTEKLPSISVLNFNKKSTILYLVFCEMWRNISSSNTSYSSTCLNYKGALKWHLDELFHTSAVNFRKLINTWKSSQIIVNKEILTGQSDQQLFHQLQEYFCRLENSSVITCTGKSWTCILSGRYLFWKNINGFEKCWLLRNDKVIWKFKNRHKRQIDYEDEQIDPNENRPEFVIRQNADNGPKYDDEFNPADMPKLQRVNVKIPENYEENLSRKNIQNVNGTFQKKQKTDDENCEDCGPIYYIVAVPTIYSLIGFTLIIIIVSLTVYSCALFFLMYRYTSIVITE